MRLRRLLPSLIAAAMIAVPAAGTVSQVAMAAPAVHASAMAFADTNGQPDPAPVTLDPDVALAMCESSAPSLGLEAFGTQLLEHCADGTPVKFNANGNTFSWGGVTYRVGTLNQPSQSPACLGVNGINNVNSQNCSTGSGVIWGHGLSNGHDVWINRLKTQNNGVLTVLAGSASLGAPAFTATWPPASGVYERWGFA